MWNMTIEIQARVMIRSFECTWSKDQLVCLTCLDRDQRTICKHDDHTTSSYVHFPAGYIPCVTKLCQSGQTLPLRAGDAIHPALQR